MCPPACLESLKTMMTADTSLPSTDPSPLVTARTATINILPNKDASAVEHYGITRRDVEQVYFSPHHFGHAYEEVFGFTRSPMTVHPAAGLELIEKMVACTSTMSRWAPRALKSHAGELVFVTPASCASTIPLYLLLLQRETIFLLSLPPCVGHVASLSWHLRSVMASQMKGSCRFL